MRKILRSLLAVISGFVVMFVIVIVCTLLCVHAMHLKTGHPTPGYLIINVMYSLAAALLSGWVTARVAGYRPLIHGIVFASILFIQSSWFLMHPASSQPLWYQVFLAIVPPVVAIAGSATVRS